MYPTLLFTGVWLVVARKLQPFLYSGLTYFSVMTEATHVCHTVAPKIPTNFEVLDKKTMHIAKW
jgi:hypothetical protein